MSPKTFSVLALLTYAQLCMAQTAPVITYSQPPAKAGVLAYFCNDSFSHPAADTGANITWDYSGLVSRGSDTLYTYTCMGDTMCSRFPNANFFSFYYLPPSTPSNYTGYSFTIVDSTGIETYGYIAASQNPQYIDTFFYTNPETTMKYPFTYSNAFSDSFAYTVDGLYIGWNYVRSDGYGTLKLPYGTFQNVLRIVDTEIISTVNHTSTTGDVSYYWISPSLGLLLSLDESVGIPQAMYFLHNGASDTRVQNINENRIAIDLYPNPLKDQLNIDLENPNNQDVKIYLVDIIGKVVDVIADKTLPAGKQHIQYTLHNLSKGIYFVRLQSEQGTVTKKIEVL